MNATDARRLSRDINNKSTSELLNKIEDAIKTSATRGDYETSLYVLELSLGLRHTIKQKLEEEGFSVKITEDQREPGARIHISWSV